MTQTDVDTDTDPGRESVTDLRDSAMPRRPLLTVTEAAQACQVGRKTIVRRMDRLAEHGATKDTQGVWHIPIEALLAVGLKPGRPSTGQPQDTDTDPDQNTGDGQVVPVALDRYEELIRAEAERDAIKEHLDDMRRSAHAWHDYAKTLQRQLEPAPKRGLFGKQSG